MLPATGGCRRLGVITEMVASAVRLALNRGGIMGMTERRRFVRRVIRALALLAAAAAVAGVFVASSGHPAAAQRVVADNGVINSHN